MILWPSKARECGKVDVHVRRFPHCATGKRDLATGAIGLTFLQGAVSCNASALCVSMPFVRRAGMMRAAGSDFQAVRRVKPRAAVISTDSGLASRPRSVRSSGAANIADTQQKITSREGHC